MINVFAGKGGVGKTTCAAASALHYSSLSEKTLAISTDVTPSLSHIFEITDSSKPAKISDRLYINELGIQEVKEMWDRKFGKEVFEVFSSFVSIEYGDFLEFMTSLLPGLFDEFMVDYIRELDLTNEYDAIIWDTAPLGQTLTLLQTPSLVLGHLRMAPRVYSKLRKRGWEESLTDIIKRWQELSRINIEFLRYQVNFTMVTIPEALAVQQLDEVFSELNKFGFEVKQLIVNNVIKDPDSSNFLISKAKEQSAYLDYIHGRFSYMKITELPMFPYEMRGLARLREAEKSLFEGPSRQDNVTSI